MHHRRAAGHLSCRQARHVLAARWSVRRARAATLGIVDLLPLQRAIYILANVFLLLGASLVLHTPDVPIMQRLGARAFAPVDAARNELVLNRSDASGRAALGLVWGLIPCALI